VACLTLSVLPDVAYTQPTDGSAYIDQAGDNGNTAQQAITGAEAFGVIGQGGLFSDRVDDPPPLSTEQSGTSRNNTAIQGLSGDVRAEILQGVNGGTAIGNTARQFVSLESAFIEPRAEVFQGDAGTAQNNTARQNLSGDFDEATIGQGRNDGSARGNAARQVLMGEDSFLEASIEQGFGPLIDEEPETTAKDNTAQQELSGSLHTASIEQGSSGGTATENSAQQTLSGSGHSATIVQGNAFTASRGTAILNTARQIISGNGEHTAFIFQTEDGGLSTANFARQEISGSSGHEALISQGSEKGTARRNVARQTFFGGNHEATIRQGVNDGTAADNLARQNLRGTGHTAVIRQNGSGHVATQTFGSFDSLPTQPITLPPSSGN
jgi:hypothetical protein